MAAQTATKLAPKNPVRKPVKAPKSPTGVPDIDRLPERYALQVSGDCMAPEIKHGEHVEVSKSAPFAKGDLVVLWLKPELRREGEAPCVMKRLAMDIPPYVTFPWTEHPGSDVHALVMVEQLNPRKRGFIKAEQLAAVHKIVGPIDESRVYDARPK